MSPPKTSQPSAFVQHGSAEQHDEDQAMVDMDVDIVTSPTEDAIPDEDRIDYEDEEDEDSSAPPVPPTSADPTQPLSSAPAMDAALDDIAIDAPGSRTRRNERRPAGIDLHAMLREKVEAQQQVAAATKAEADGAAASGRAARPRLDKRSRPLSGSSPTAPGKKAKGANPATDPNAMDTTGAKPAKSRPTSFEHLFKPGRLPCAVRIDRCPIMGNPFSQTPGYDVNVDLDPGRLAQPSVGLDFKFSKDGTDSRLQGHYNTFTVGWEPGVRVGDKWMMESFGVEAATNPSDPKMLGFTYPAAIRELCSDPKQADRLYCATFESNVHKTTPMTEEWAKSLPGTDWVAPYQNLQRMLGVTYLAAIQKLCKDPKDAARLVCATFKSIVHKTSPMEEEWAKTLKGETWIAPYNNLKRMYSGEDPNYNATVWFMPHPPRELISSDFVTT